MPSEHWFASQPEKRPKHPVTTAEILGLFTLAALLTPLAVAGIIYAAFGAKLLGDAIVGAYRQYRKATVE